MSPGVRSFLLGFVAGIIACMSFITYYGDRGGGWLIEMGRKMKTGAQGGSRHLQARRIPTYRRASPRPVPYDAGYGALAYTRSAAATPTPESQANPCWGRMRSSADNSRVTLAALLDSPMRPIRQV